MAEIFPFRAYRYNSALVDPAKVLTQPYDKITPAMAEKYAAASPYNLIPIEKGKSLPEDTPANNVYTRAAKTLDDWIRGHGQTAHHPAGTCRMGADDDAVVDAELRVKGIAGLRVADCSIMPQVVGANTNAPTIMIAEKAADCIRGRPALPPASLPLPA